MGRLQMSHTHLLWISRTEADGQLDGFAGDEDGHSGWIRSARGKLEGRQKLRTKSTPVWLLEQPMHKQLPLRCRV